VCVQSLLTGVVLSHHSAWGGAALVHHSRGCEAPGVKMSDVLLTAWSLMDRNSYGKMCLYQAVLIPHQSYHDDYVYPSDRVVVSDGDGMSFSTRVPAVRYVWVPVAVSYCARH
jgi:hypothetical protein